MKDMLIGAVKVVCAYTIAWTAGCLLLAGGINQFADGLKKLKKEVEG